MNKIKEWSRDYIVLTLMFFLVAMPVRAFRVVYGQSVDICVSNNEKAVVHTSSQMLQNDWKRVLGISPQIVNGPCKESKLLVGTVGSSVLTSCGIGLDELRGKSQAYLIGVNERDQLVVAGSDAWGTAYGLVELTRMLGVSPWEWWADVTPRTLKSFSLKRGYRSSVQEPSVKYRGIFINDEDWGLMPWSYQTMEPGQPKGTIGPKTTERIFELLLRLKANLYWPPMHECSRPFFLTTGNREVAERYGIFIGTSHCEPMACNVANEWRLRGHGSYDYVHNRDSVQAFWKERVKDVAAQPIIYTLGMRGVHDGAMQGVSNAEEGKQALTQVIARQRQMLGNMVVRDGQNPFGYQRVEDVPQVFIPYKEVLDVYRAGLQVPDEATLVWCDDNYGYVRHFPTEAERGRKGGNGIYYHVSYWGRPHDYLWLGTFSPGLLVEQMTRAYNQGIRQLWVLNVGDIKPAEYQMQLFLDMAWDMNSPERHLNRFMSSTFGSRYAGDLTELMQEHYRLAFIRKPEMMGNTRTEERDKAYSRVKDLPWTQQQILVRLQAYEDLEQRAEQLAEKMPVDRQEAFFQLVKYPVQAAAEMNKKMLYAQLARHGRADWALSDAAYDSIQVLTDLYNQGLNGRKKWKGMMDAAPRNLPVFDRVPHEVATDSLPSEETLPFLTLSGMELKGQGVKALTVPLGYTDEAVELEKNEVVSYDVWKRLSRSVPNLRKRSQSEDSIDIVICILPTHPADDTRVALSVSMDGQSPVILDYTTQGRSEEWKENVLNNRAICSLRLPVSAFAKGRKLTLKALDNVIVLDQILFCHSRQAEMIK